MPLENAPQIALVELQVAEAAQRARTRPVHETSTGNCLGSGALQLALRPRRALLVLRLSACRACACQQ
jgi:hypothetical protein